MAAGDPRLSWGARSVGHALYAGLGVCTGLFLAMLFYPEDQGFERAWFASFCWNVAAWTLAIVLFSPWKGKPRV